MIEKYAYDEKDLVDWLGTGKRTMKRWITASDLSFRAGFTKLHPGDTMQKFNIMHEFFYTISGKWRWSGRPRLDGPEVTFEAGPGDVVYIQKGTQVKAENISDEPVVSFYIAVPASSQGLGYELFSETKRDDTI